jgi:hypothetical protein
MATRELTESETATIEELRAKHGTVKSYLVADTLCVVRKATRLELEALSDALTQSMRPPRRGQSAPSYSDARYKLGIAAWAHPTALDERKRILTDQGAFAMRSCDAAEAMAEDGIEELEGN